MMIGGRTPPIAVVAGFAFGFWYSGLMGIAWESWSAHRAKAAAEAARVELIEQDGRERSFAAVCPDYYAQNWFNRQIGFRSLRWCENYRDRIGS